MANISLSIAGRREAGSQSQLTNNGRQGYMPIHRRATIRIYGKFGVAMWPNLHVFQVLKETGVPRGNPCILTPHKKASLVNSWDRTRVLPAVRRQQFLFSRTILSLIFFPLSGHDDTASRSRPAISYRSTFSLSLFIFLNSVPFFM